MAWVSSLLGSLQPSEVEDSNNSAYDERKDYGLFGGIWVRSDKELYEIGRVYGRTKKTSAKKRYAG